MKKLWSLAPFACACVFVALQSNDARAGEIAGMRSQLPPTSDPDLTINFSNDFFGRGGSVDDFRTTQIILGARIGERWVGVFDHSTLTLESSPETGRLDQITASFGYRFVDRTGPGKITRVAVGSGLRSTGDFNGERMQNGFHRLINSRISELPYLDTSGVDATLWIDADHYSVFHTSQGDGLLGGWRSSYWIRAQSLLTTDTQWDNALGAYLVASRNPFDIWFGARRDWRSGYDQDFLQNATAQAEDDLALVFGIRMGALVLETVQQLNNKASYGQLKLISDGRKQFPAGSAWPRFSVEFGFIVPDVLLQLAGKRRIRLLTESGSTWHESLVVDVRYGEPQFGDDTSRYVRTGQLALGMEWERQLGAPLGWIGAYGGVNVGLRREQLLGDGMLSGQSSESIDRATAAADIGFRFAAAELGGGWRYRLQLGLTGWSSFGDANLMFNGQDVSLHNTGVGVSLGMTFDYE